MQRAVSIYFNKGIRSNSGGYGREVVFPIQSLCTVWQEGLWPSKSKIFIFQPYKVKKIKAQTLKYGLSCVKAKNRHVTRDCGFCKRKKLHSWLWGPQSLAHCVNIWLWLNEEVACKSQKKYLKRPNYENIFPIWSQSYKRC
jgi:hypothetical protein